MILYYSLLFIQLVKQCNVWLCLMTVYVCAHMCVFVCVCVCVCMSVFKWTKVRLSGRTKDCVKVFSHILPYYKLPVLGFTSHSKIWNELIEEKKRKQIVFNYRKKPHNFKECLRITSFFQPLQNSERERLYNHGIFDCMCLVKKLNLLPLTHTGHYVKQGNILDT